MTTDREPSGSCQAASGLRDGLVVALALTTGTMDAVSYLRLGHVFSGVITENLALLGVSAGAWRARGRCGHGTRPGRGRGCAPRRSWPGWPG